MGPRGRGADRSDFGSNGSNAVLPVGLTVAFGACLDDDRGICIPGAEDQEALLQPWQLLQSDKDRYIRGHAVIGPTLHFEDRHVRCDDRDKQPRFAGLAWPGSAWFGRGEPKNNGRAYQRQKQYCDTTISTAMALSRPMSSSAPISATHRALFMSKAPSPALDS